MEDYKKNVKNFANLANLFEEENIDEKDLDNVEEEELEQLDEVVGTALVAGLGAVGAKLFKNKDKLSRVWDKVKKGDVKGASKNLWNAVVTDDLTDAVDAYAGYVKKSFNVDINKEKMATALVSHAMKKFDKLVLKGKDIDQVEQSDLPKGSDAKTSDQEDPGAQE